MRARFGPTVLVGLASAGATALLAGRELAAPDSSSAVAEMAAQGTAASTLPLAQALGLVALASWGVLLVTRGVVRRLVAVLAALAAAGAAITLLLGRSTVLDGTSEALRELGVADAGVGLTTSYWLALLASLVCLLASLVAVRAVPGWPEMGRRYDAPSAAQQPAPTRSDEPVDLWRALDEGRDPTGGPTP